MSDEPKQDRFAPEGYCWVCLACGKISNYDKYGIEGENHKGWDESCVMNCMLVEENKLIKGTKGRVIHIKD